MSDIRAKRGNTQTYIVNFTNSSGDEVDITGWTVWMTVKCNEDDLDTSAKVQKTNAIHTDPTGGTTTFLLSATDTENLKGVYFYDVKFKNTAGTIKTVIKGKFIVEGTVTQAK